MQAYSKKQKFDWDGKGSIPMGGKVTVAGNVPSLQFDQPVTELTLLDANVSIDVLNCPKLRSIDMKCTQLHLNDDLPLACVMMDEHCWVLGGKFVETKEIMCNCPLPEHMYKSETLRYVDCGEVDIRELRAKQMHFLRATHKEKLSGEDIADFAEAHPEMRHIILTVKDEVAIGREDMVRMQDHPALEHVDINGVVCLTFNK